MEKLVTCSKIFYDREIIDKIKYLNQKIESLKRTQVFLEKPKIEYSSFEEWETTKEKAYQIIKNGLDQWIIDDNFEYCDMIEWGLTPVQRRNITYNTEKALNLITKENSKEWSENIANTITYGIEGFLNAFIQIGNWESIYSRLTPETMVELIYNNIIWQLDDERTSSCKILDYIPLYPCKGCGKKISSRYNCFSCECGDN